MFIPPAVFPAGIFAEMYNPGSTDVVDIPPPQMSMIAPPTIAPPAAPSMEELVQQSQWNLQQQEQHMHTLRQVQSIMNTSGIEDILPSGMIHVSFCLFIFLCFYFFGVYLSSALSGSASNQIRSQLTD